MAFGSTLSISSRIPTPLNLTKDSNCSVWLCYVGSATLGTTSRRVNPVSISNGLLDRRQSTSPISWPSTLDTKTLNESEKCMMLT